VAEVIDNELSKWKQFTVADIERHVGIDSRRYIRLLVRVGFLRTVPAEEGGKVGRSDPWPPPAEFFKGSPIGIAYYLQKWFRFNLQE
jgi:hypothetical protein